MGIAYRLAPTTRDGPVAGDLRMNLDVKRIMGIIGSGAVGGIIAIFTLTGANRLAGDQRIAKAEVVRPVPTARVDGEERTVTVARSSDLSYHLLGSINGRDVPMLVDTGANITVLTPADAMRIGVRPSREIDDYTAVTGITREVRRFRNAGRVTIRLGPITLVDVPVSIDADGQLQQSILGQDALCNVRTMRIENATLSFVHDSPYAVGCVGGPMHNADQ